MTGVQKKYGWPTEIRRFLLPKVAPPSLSGLPLSERRPERNRLKKFDLEVFHLLVVEGFEDGLAPLPGKWVQACLAGAVVFAETGDLIDLDNGCRHYDDDFFLTASHQMIVELLDDKSEAPTTIKEALVRLTMPSHSNGDTFTKVVRVWNPPLKKEKPYIQGSRSFGHIAKAQLERTNFEKFRNEELAYLMRLVEGWRLVREELVKKIRPSYNW